MLERADRGNEADGARPFSAFLSYSHADEAAARRLQEAIETYRVPSRIVGTSGPFGPVPARLKPIFRDRDELVAASNLEAALAEALRKADALIVLCSPAAVASEWVNREIALFHDMRGGSRIFAAFIDGEGEREIVPPALLERVGVPLAADFRPHGDGTRIARLKVIAALLGTSLGALEQRDTARRNRRLVWTALASLGVAVAFGVVAARAIRAEALARAEQARSERMVETLIADLREAVKPVGSLALLARVNETALAYYRGQNLAEMSEASLLQRARLLIAMGEDEIARGNIGIARTHFAEAHRTTAARLAQAPDDGQARFDHGQSEYWMGYAAWLLAEPETARRHFERYAEIAEALVREAPDNPAWQMEAGHAGVNLGMLALRQWGNATAARAQFETAIDHFDSAGRLGADPAMVDPERRNATGWLADALRVEGSFDAARRLWRTRLKESEEALARRPADKTARRDRLVATTALLRIETEAGNPRGALALVDGALGDAALLVRADPDDAVAAEDQRMAELLAARAALALPSSERPPLASIAARIGRCRKGGSTAILPETERYCQLVLARLRLAEGRAAEARLLAVGPRPAAGAPRLSETWGIDFDAEMRSILEQG